MDVRPVDPRDTTWEIDSPVYRVYFWTRLPAPPGIRPDEMMYRSKEFEVTGAADIHEVLEWAETNGDRDSTYTIYAVLERDGKRGLVRLAGVDPTAAT